MALFRGFHLFLLVRRSGVEGILAAVAGAGDGLARILGRGKARALQQHFAAGAAELHRLAVVDHSVRAKVEAPFL